MEVHEAIASHSQKQHHIVATFFKLDQDREKAIETAVKLCQKESPFSVDPINEITKKINDLAKQGIVPTRKFVTKEMVQEYTTRLKNK
ncbi:YpbS family protein [Ectobacillus polymachus]|uniref:YpbS family protein n=1 Tax=Ectobacillus polymachus TaxID=1508806 RepID=UPI003A848230